MTSSAAFTSVPPRAGFAVPSHCDGDSQGPCFPAPGEPILLRRKQLVSGEHCRIPAGTVKLCRSVAVALQTRSRLLQPGCRALVGAYGASQ